ncbi:MAG: tandem-95 repeat protein [Opitutaceae bacterium]
MLTNKVLQHKTRIALWFSVFVFIFSSLSVHGAVSRQAPDVNGLLEGDVYQIEGDGVNVNSGGRIEGTWYLPGSPNVTLQGGVLESGSVLHGDGSSEPSGYRIRLNRNSYVEAIVDRTLLIDLPIAGVAVSTTGTRTVHINNGSDSIGDASTIKNLTINTSNVDIALPAGSYNRLAINGQSTLTIGTSGATEPEIYDVRQLNLNSGSHLNVVGPVLLRLKQSFNPNALVGNEEHPEWLRIEMATNGMNINSNAQMYAVVICPSKSVHINGLLEGGLYADKIKINSQGAYRERASIFPDTSENQAPVAVSDNFDLVEDGMLVEIAQGSDPDGDTIEFSLLSDVANGELAFSATGEINYIPAPNYFGADQFTFQVSDGSATSAPATIQFTIASINDLPVVTVEPFSVEEDLATPISLIIDDVDSATFSITQTSVVNGSLSGGVDTLTFTPELNYSGAASFTITVSDGDGGELVVDQEFVVGAINDAPVPTVTDFTIDEDVALQSRLFASDIENESLVFALVEDAENGTATVQSDGEFTYVPVPDYNGTDIFKASVEDASGALVIYDVNVSVSALNDAPRAVDQSFGIPEDSGTLSQIVVAEDIEGDEFTFALATAPTKGTATVQADGSFEYTPNENLNGSDVIEVSVTDEFGAQSSFNALIIIDPVNDQPVAEAFVGSAHEDSLLSGQLVGADIDGDALIFTLATPPIHGDVVINTLGAFTYTPSEDFNGVDTFTFTVSDEEVASEEVTVSLTLLPVNDAPEADDQSFETIEDSTLNAVITVDDVDGDALDFSLLASPQQGSVTVQADGLFTYAPGQDYVGADSFSVEVSDGSETIIVNISVSVTAGNDAPVAQELSFTINEDGNLVDELLAEDVDGDSLTYVINSLPQNGELRNGGNRVEFADLPLEIVGNEFSYLPAPNFYGSDNFSFFAKDGSANSNIAIVTLVVVPVNDAPVVVIASFSNAEDILIDGQLLGADVDGDALTFELVENASNGTVQVGADGLFAYSPNTDFNGSDSFTYRASDGEIVSEAATVELTVAAVNDAPIASSEVVSLDEDTTLDVELVGEDVDLDTLTFSITIFPLNGSISGVAPNLTYTPNANFYGSDSFAFTVADADETSAPGTISINIIPVNDEPVAFVQAFTTQEDTSFAGAIAASDEDGDSLTFTLVDDAVDGDLILESDGSFTYTPAENENGAKTFSFNVSDGEAVVGPVSLEINIEAENDAPIADESAFSIVEDSELEATLSGSDVDGDNLTFELTQEPENGVLILGSDGAFTYVSAQDFFGQDVFSFRVSDGELVSESASVVITVAPVNDSPIASALSIAIDEDQDASGSLVGSDADGDSLIFSLSTEPSNGVVTLTPDGVFEYTPNANYFGNDSFGFVVSDETATSEIAQVSIIVNSVNDQPVAFPTAVSIEEDSSVEGQLFGEDVDGDVFTFNLASPASHGSVTLAIDGTYTYVPNSDYNGIDSFSFTVADSSEPSEPASVAITVTSVNDLPIALSQSTSTGEDTALEIELSATDADLDTLSYVVTVDPEHGVLSGVTPNLIYTPDHNYNGLDSFSFVAVDSEGASTAALVEIDVLSANDAPTAESLTINLDEDNSFVGQLIGIDADGDALTFSKLTEPENGLLNLNSDGSYQYTPNTDYNGSDNFSFQVFDGTETSVSALAEIVVQPVNDAPVVDAGADETVQLPDTLSLSGVAFDDGDTVGELDILWEVLGDATGVVFADTTDPQTSVGFASAGVYELRLTAGDGELTTTDTLQVVVDYVNLPPVITSTPVTVRERRIDDSGAVDINITNWEVVRFPDLMNSGNADPLWTIQDGGITAVQQRNAVASLFMDAREYSDETVRGTFAVQTDSDDDFIGFAFGYQNNKQFYIFSWKQGTQITGAGITVPQGMAVFKVDSPVELVLGDTYAPTDDGRVVSLYRNDIGWADDAEYEFELELAEVGFTITIYDSGVILDTFTILDDRYPSGRFGFYNESQESSFYTGFTSEVSVSSSYYYDVDAIDVDGDELTYSLVNAPQHMEIDVQAGEVRWLPRADQVGAEVVTIRVTDTEGNFSEQDFTINVIDNYPPQVSAGPDVKIPSISELVTLNSTVADDHLALSDLSVEWSLVEGPAEIIFSDISVINPTLSFSENGGYLVELSVSDGTFNIVDNLYVEVGLFDDMDTQSGLMAWFPFNVDTVDQVSGLSGLIAGSASYTDGLVESGVYLGESDTISVGSDANVDVASSTDGFTVEFWIRLDAYGGRLFQWGDSLDVRAELGSGNQFRFFTKDVNDSEQSTIISTSAISSTIGEWLHMAFTYDRATGLSSIYLDGELLLSRDHGQIGDYTSGTLTIGDSLDGTYDEFSIYNRPLEWFEILEIYKSEDGKVDPLENAAPSVRASLLGDQPVVTGVDVYLDGQVSDDGEPYDGFIAAQWSQVSGPSVSVFADVSDPRTNVQFDLPGRYILMLTGDDGSRQTESMLTVDVGVRESIDIDSSSVAWWTGDYTNLDELNGIPMYLFRDGGYADDGRIGGAFSFAEEDYAQVSGGALDVSSFTDGFTVEFWIRLDEYGGRLFQWGESRDVRAELGSSNQFRFFTRDVNGSEKSTIISTSVISSTVGEWRHMAFTYDKSTGLGSIYLDGELLLFRDHGQIGDYTSGILTIGDSVGGTYDEFSIYDRPLDWFEILEIYKSQEGKVDPLENAAPVVTASLLSDQSVVVGVDQLLDGQVSDDGEPYGGFIASQWSLVSGPGEATFADVTDLESTVQFDSPGRYILKLTGDDGSRQAETLLTVDVEGGESIDVDSSVVAWWTGDYTNLDELNGLPMYLFRDGGYADDGFVGSAFSFGDEDYAQTSVGALDVASSANGFTVEFWIRLDEYGGRLFQWGESRDVRAELGSSNQFRFWTRDVDGVSRSTVSGTSAISSTVGEWRHMAFTYDRVTGLGSIYLDGELFLSRDHGQLGDYTSGILTIGDSIDGTYDEFSVYDRPLGESEIQSIFNASTAGKSPLGANEAPQVFAGLDDFAFVGIEYTLSGSLADDGRPVGSTPSAAWSLVDGPGNAIFSDVSTVGTSVVFDTAGTYTLQLLGSDSILSSADTVQIVVEPRVVQNPTILSLPNTSFDIFGSEQTYSYLYQVVAVDPLDEVLSYSLIEGPSGMAIDPVSGLLEWSVDSQPSSSFDITVRAINESGGVAFQSYQLQVNRFPNQVPVITSSPITSHTINKAREVLANYSFLSFEELDAELFVESTQITDEFLETHGISFTLEGDGDGPVLAQVGSPQIAFEGFELLADQPAPGQNVGQFFLTDDGIVSGAPESIIIDLVNPSSSMSGTLIDIDGAEAWRIEAFDENDRLVDIDLIDIDSFNSGEGLATSWSMTSIVENIIKVRLSWNGSQQSGGVGVAFDNFSAYFTSEELGQQNRLYQYQVEATDPEGERLVYSLLEAPASMFIDAESGLISWLTDVAEVGDHTVIVEVVDADGSVAQQRYSLSLLCNDVPQVDAGEDLFIADSGTTVQLDASVVDDGVLLAQPALTWSVLNGPGNVTFAPDAQSLDAEVSFDLAGVYRLQLTANDGYTSASDTIVAYVETLSTAPADSSLVAWWPGDYDFEETVSGMPSVSKKLERAPGVVLDAMRFYGDGFIFAPAGTGADIAAQGAFTIEAWVKPDSLVSQMPLVQWFSETGDLGVHIFTSGSSADIKIPSTVGAVVDITTRNGLFTEGLFTHIAVSYDPSTGYVLIYKDGALFDLEFIGAITPVTDGDFYIGTRPNTSFNYVGLLDELSLYNAALPATKIERIYDAGQTGKSSTRFNGAPVVLAGDDTQIGSTAESLSLLGLVFDDGLPLHSNLEVKWSLVDGPGAVTFSNEDSPESTAVFSSEGIYNLRLEASDSRILSSDTISVVVGPCMLAANESVAAWWRGADMSESIHDLQSYGAGVETVSAHVGEGLSFSGGEFVFVPNTVETDIGAGDGFSIEFWVQPNSANASQPLVQWIEDGSLGVHIWSQGTGLDINLRDINGAAHAFSTASNAIEAGTFTHIVFTYDKTSGTAVVYKNGQVHDQRDLGIFEPRTNQDFYIGHRGGTSYYFNGILDEVTLYTEALTAGESLDLYSADTLGKCPNASVNQAPIVLAGVDQVIPFGSLGILSAFVVDDGLPANETITTNWSQVSGPTGGTATFDDALSLTPSVSFDRTGTYSLRLEATDQELTAYDVVQITVIPVTTQTFAVSAGVDRTVTVNQALSLMAVASGTLDPSQQITYSWTAAGPGGIFFSDSSFEQISATFDAPGTYAVTVQASYGGVTASDTLSVVVNETPTNQAPILSLHSSFESNTLDTLSISAIIVDDGLPAGGTLDATWTQLSGPSAAALSPATASFSAQQNTLTSLVDFDLAGDYQFQLVVTDGSLTTTQLVEVTVTTVDNQAPIVSLGGNQKVSIQDGLDLTALVSDDGLPENSSLAITWTRVSGPGFVSVDDPTSTSVHFEFGAVGHYVVGLQASDGALSTSDTLQIEVGDGPSVAMVTPTSGTQLEAGELVNVIVNATDTDGIAQVELFDSVRGSLGMGSPIAGTDDFSFTFTAPAQAGIFELYAVATDVDDFQADSDAIVVYTALVGVELDAFIANPLEDAIITQPTPVLGSASSPLLDSWTLAYRLQGESLWTTLETQSTSVTDGTLGTLDPTLLLNGIYDLRLRVTDLLGTTVTDTIKVSVDGSMKVGNFALAFEDLTVPMAGIPIQIIRSYDSLDSRMGDFGTGWSLAINDIRIQKNAPLGENWRQVQIPSILGNGATDYCLEPIGKRLVSINFPGGEQHLFEMSIDVGHGRDDIPDNCKVILPIAEAVDVVFTPKGDTTGTLEAVDVQQVYNSGFVGETELFTEDPFLDFSAAVYNPTRFILTTTDGTRYLIDEADGLISMEDLNGNTLEVFDDRIVSTAIDPNGGADIVREVTFLRDGEGRITTIIDPDGNTLDYGYEVGQSGLHTFTNRVDETTEFVYADARFPNYLTDILDPRGIQAIRTEYDDEGRIARQIDADGNPITFDHDLDNFAERVTDRLGNTTTYYYDDLGNVTRQVDPLGAETLFEYYPGTELVKYETDDVGNVTSMAYDSKENLLVEITGALITEDPLTATSGYITRYTYNEFSSPLTISDPNGNLTEFTYDGQGNLLSQIQHGDGGETLTTGFTYTNGGDIATITDAVGNVTSYTYAYNITDASFPTAVKRQTVTITDATRGVLRTTESLYDAQENLLAERFDRTLPDSSIETVQTSYQYDEENRLLATFLPDGQVAETRYNDIGKAAASIRWQSAADYATNDLALARVTTMTYDDRGNLISTDYPDGTSTRVGYNLEGRMIWSANQLDQVTAMAYDALGRQTHTLMPDGASSVSSSDLAGLAWNTYADLPAAFDDYVATETIYDSIGRVEFSIDALGNIAQNIYDDACACAGRLKETRRFLTPESYLHTAYTYDANGNQITVTDPKGNATEFVYDDYNRLIQTKLPVTAEHGATTANTEYDDLGRRIATIDQEGKRTEYDYDALGRLVEVRQEDPDTLGSLIVTASYTYDEAGNRLTETDAEGQTTRFEYDNMGRRTQRTLAEDQFETYAYNAWGELEARTDFNGHVTSYTYDAMSRLLTERADADAFPSEVGITYTYDALGRIQTMVDATGTTTHVYDTRGNLLSKANAAGTLTYTYDNANNLTSTSSGSSGGLSLSYDYDGLNRLDTVTDNGAATPPLEHSYSYDANGNLETLSYSNGVTHTWLYDSQNRLKNLSILNSQLSTLNSYAYTLRASGHRSQITESTGRTVGYSYDNQYRLIQEAITGDPSVVDGTSDWEYDLVGNRLSQTSTLDQILDRAETYSANNWLDSHTYDDNGNTTESSAELQSADLLRDFYDWRNRLIRREKADGTIIEITYDGFGDRLKKTILNSSFVIPNSTWFLVDRNNLTGYAQVVEEVGEGDELQVIYSYGLDLISQDRRNDDSSGNFTQSFYLYDGLGSVRALTDSSGVVTDEYTYDAWGVLVSTAHSSLPTVNCYLFTGEQWDEDLQMVFLRARYLNTSTGRFHTMDTFEGVTTDPVTLHKYLYANAAPNMWTDPSGLFTLVELLFALNVQSIKQAAKAITANQARKKAVVKLGCVVGVNQIKNWMDLEFSMDDRSNDDGKPWHKHHPIPTAGGGPNENLQPLHPATHQLFHHVLDILLKAGGADGDFKDLTNNSSAEEWAAEFAKNKSKKAYLATIKVAARFVDKTCKLKWPKRLVDYIKKNEDSWLGNRK